MILQLFIAGLILGLIFFFAMEGLYSAIVMAVCAVFSLALAFHFAEPLGSGFRGMSAELGDAIGLAVAFVVPLAAMRVLADRLLPGMVHFPYWVDRVGGAALGAVSALIMMGVLVLCIRMLPFGAGVLGYRPFATDAPAAPAPQVAPLWLRPDGFAVGLVSKLSGGSMRGARSFAQVHPDYPTELSGFTFVAPSTRPTSSSQALAPLKVRTPAGDQERPAVGTWIVVQNEAPTDLPDPLPKQTAEDALRFEIAGQTFQLLRVDIQPAVLVPGDPAYRLNGGQAQLTAYRVDEQGRRVDAAPTVVRFAGWVVEDLRRMDVIRPLGVSRAWQHTPAPRSDAGPPRIGLIFALPQGYRPWFLTVLRHTRVQVHVLGGAEDVRPPDRSEDPRAGIAVSGNWPVPADRWQKSLSARSRVALSVTGPANGTAQAGAAGANVELVGNRLSAVALQGGLEDLQTRPGGRLVQEFHAPEHHRIVQLHGDIGGNIGGNFWLRLTNGLVRAANREIPLAGIALRTRDNHWLLFYDAASAVGRFQGSDLLRLTQAGGPVQSIHLVLVVPADARSLVLDLGDDTRIQVELE